MGASFCLQDGYIIRHDQPLRLRYLLHAHAGAYNAAQAETVHRAFASRPDFIIFESKQRHRQFDVRRR